MTQAGVSVLGFSIRFSLKLPISGYGLQAASSDGTFQASPEISESPAEKDPTDLVSVVA